MGAAKDLFLRIDFDLSDDGVIFYPEYCFACSRSERHTERRLQKRKRSWGIETGWKLFLCFAGILRGTVLGRLLETFSEQSGTDA